ncbi:MAG: hypothetical protein A2X32_04265 [Elusimicrobia bacterium GWC2_64_44]|nr:MAG: hypothetical protein A2X32_04265 [Elusimicrobia bacterium GWC2_64_44]
MKKTTILTAVFAAVLASASLAGAQAVNQDFDGKASRDFVSLKQLVTENAPEVKLDGLKADRLPGHYEPETACQTLHLIDRDGTAPTWRTTLSSDYMMQYWETDHYGNSHSYWASAASYNIQVQLKTGYRQLRDRETEYIKVCYDFYYKRESYSVTSPFTYEVIKRALPGNVSGFSLELIPLGRTPQAPEASAMELSEFSYDHASKQFTLLVKSNFSSDYYGHKVEFSVELMRDGLFDSSKGKQTYEAEINAASGSYIMKFKEGDLPKSLEAGESRAKDKKFFVKWGFSVKGTGAFVDKGRTDPVTVPQ